MTYDICRVCGASRDDIEGLGVCALDDPDGELPPPNAWEQDNCLDLVLWRQECAARLEAEQERVDAA